MVGTNLKCRPEIHAKRHELYKVHPGAWRMRKITQSLGLKPRKISTVVANLQLAPLVRKILSFQCGDDVFIILRRWRIRDNLELRTLFRWNPVLTRKSRHSHLLAIKDLQSWGPSRNCGHGG